MTDNGITREKTFSEELPYFKERIKEVFDNYDNPNGCEDSLYIDVLRDSKRIVRKAEEEINRQQEEIENLTYTLLGVMNSVDKWLDGTELEQDEVNRSATMREKTLRIVEEKHAEIERLKGWENLLKTESHAPIKAKARAEAIKEFAERLKEKAYPFPCAIGVENAVTIRAINDLVKEMTHES